MTRRLSPEPVAPGLDPGGQAKQMRPVGAVDPRIKSAGDGWDEFDFKESLH